MEVADAVPVAGQGDPGLSHALGLQGEKQSISKLRTPTFRERQADATNAIFYIPRLPSAIFDRGEMRVGWIFFSCVVLLQHLHCTSFQDSIIPSLNRYRTSVKRL